MCKDLRDKLSSKKTCNLIVNGNDEEFLEGVSQHQKSKVNLQGKHFLRALEIVCSYYSRNENVTWIISCEISFNELLSDFCGRKIERWFVTHEENN